MRVFLTILSGVAALALGMSSAREERGPDPLPPAQQLGQHALWDSFFSGCTEGGAASEYVCACAGTLLIDRCARHRRDENRLAACLQDPANIRAVTGRCLSYGNLANGSSIPAAPVRPMAPAPQDATRTTRLDRWIGSYRGCMSHATPEERQRAPSMSYTCACFATYIVNSCAPSDTTANVQVVSCIENIGTPQLGQVALACDQFGALRPR